MIRNFLGRALAAHVLALAFAPALGAAPESGPHLVGENPIVFTLYTVHRGVLKMSVQMEELAEGRPRTVRLEVRRGDAWAEVAAAPIATPGWTALLRVEGWDASKDVPYRVRHGEDAAWEGLIRRDPAGKDEIVVAAFTGNGQSPADPKRDLVEHVGKVDPDLLVFTGDQTYNHASHFKGWTWFGREFGELTRSRPTVCIPDDHDVGQGNLWGAGGRAAKVDNEGGYLKAPAYVNEVQRAQTAHLPDPYDPTPVEQGIAVYYTSLHVGGVDFAILEDRKFKSGCAGLVTREMGPRPDHVTAKDYDPKALDAPGRTLLGERQLEFLRAWAAEWRGAAMKAVISQTIFCNVTNYHAKGKLFVRADLDSNGWPQSGRNRALAEMRRGFAFHVCGDQHLAAVVHQGIDDWGDAGWAFCVPSILNTWPRWWLPEEPGLDREPGAPAYTGRFLDGLGNRITVHAVANPTYTDPKDATPEARSPGFGIVRFNKKARTITLECWPRHVDPTDPANARKQYAGWPRTIRQEDNYGRRAVAWLPTIEVAGMTDPVVQVVREADGEVVYTLRIAGTTWRPKVFAEGRYTVHVGELGTERVRTLRGLAAAAEEAEEKTVRVDLAP